MENEQYYMLYNIDAIEDQMTAAIMRQAEKGKEGIMVFNTGAALLDAIVLAVVNQDEIGTYGYKITQEVRQVLDVSESTLYPVLRRLQKSGYLDVYDRECAGRNRRYYKVTADGKQQLADYKKEWKEYSAHINAIFEGGNHIE